MTNLACRRAVLATLVLLVSTACSRSASPTAPASTAATPPAAPVATPAFPAVAATARIYAAPNSWPRPSRYVLYEDGSFALQYSGLNDYLGTYEETNGAITFAWKDSNLAGPWGATGTITADTLTVRYNAVMQLADFEDAAYSRVR